MKITQEVLNYYNTHKGIFSMPSYNDEYNKAHNIPTRAEWTFLNGIHNDHFGIGRGVITLKMIRNISNNGE